MTTMPTTAILDGDLVIFRAACWAEKHSPTHQEMAERLRFDIDYWTPKGTTTRLVAMSCSRADNYRKDFWPTYKANRDGKPVPSNLAKMKEMVANREEIMFRDRMEADDLIGIGMSSGKCVGVSLDKDMTSVPGWFWNPDKQAFPTLITEEEADNFFYKQWIMGDSTDNIPGIPKMGPKKAEAFLADLDNTEKAAAIIQLYADRGLDLDYCLAQARCVRIVRDHEWCKDKQEHVLYDPSS
jgi:hypothetical protein